MTWRLEHPRLMVAFLFLTVALLSGELELDNFVLDRSIVAMHYCLQREMGIR